MRKAALAFLMTATVVAMLTLPEAAFATSYEDGLEDCSYPKMVDLLFMRPVGLGALGMGTVMWLPAAPWVLVTSRQDSGYVFETLVARPARFTFRRSLGDCLPNTGL